MPKLALRDLFSVVTIVALILGWWVDRIRLIAANDRRMAALQLENEDLLADIIHLRVVDFRWRNPVEIEEALNQVRRELAASKTSDQPSP